MEVLCWTLNRRTMNRRPPPLLLRRRVAVAVATGFLLLLLLIIIWEESWEKAVRMPDIQTLLLLFLNPTILCGILRLDLPPRLPLSLQSCLQQCHQSQSLLHRC